MAPLAATRLALEAVLAARVREAWPLVVLRTWRPRRGRPLTSRLSAFISTAALSAGYSRRGHRVSIYHGAHRFDTPFDDGDWMNERPEANRVLLCLVADLCVSPRWRRALWLDRLRIFLGEAELKALLEAMRADGFLTPKVEPIAPIRLVTASPTSETFALQLPASVAQ